MNSTNGSTYTASITAGSSSEHITLDAQVECLCCERLLMINSESWRKIRNPYALCKGCGHLPSSVAKAFYALRVRTRNLEQKIAQLEKDLFEPSQPQA